MTDYLGLTNKLMQEEGLTRDHSLSELPYAVFDVDPDITSVSDITDMLDSHLKNDVTGGWGVKTEGGVTIFERGPVSVVTGKIRKFRVYVWGDIVCHTT